MTDISNVAPTNRRSSSQRLNIPTPRFGASFFAIVGGLRPLWTLVKAAKSVVSRLRLSDASTLQDEAIAILM
jgi:hypothetical protein